MKSRAPTPQKDPTLNTGVNVRQQINNMKDINPVKTFNPNAAPNSFKYGLSSSDVNSNFGAANR